MSFLKPSVLGVLLLAASCRNGDRHPEPMNARPEPGRVAALYFSTEVSGYIEPCGCTSEPLGGLPRLAAVIRASKVPHALVDAGNLLFPAEGLDAATEEQHLFKARLLSRVYRDLGAVALNLGRSDLLGGMKLLKEIQHEGAFPLVSANVRPVGDGVPSVARSFIREVGGIKFGLTGVARPESFAGSELVTAIEYAPVLRAELSRLKEQGAEVVVLLAHVEEADARELARLLPELDLIVRAPGSPITRPPSPPFRVGGVIVSEAGSQGQHAGRLTVRLLGPRAPGPLAFDDAGYAQARELELTERKLTALRRALEASSKSEGGASQDERRAQIAKLEARRQALLVPEPPRSGSSLRIELVALSKDTPSDPMVEKLLSSYYAQLKDMNLEKGDVRPCAPLPEVAVYVGSAPCQECHEDAYAFWQKTKHAKAWATLEDANKHFDLTCIGCHTIGYQKPGGFCRLADVSGRKDVGCEMCHGPGSLHVEDSDPSSIVLESSEGTCMKMCHVPEHSDRFNYQTYLREVTGEGHALSAAGP